MPLFLRARLQLQYSANYSEKYRSELTGSHEFTTGFKDDE
jgi:hypothetical protein